jgi:ferredoxin/bacterioferritin-associated ferredoxin
MAAFVSCEPGNILCCLFCNNTIPWPSQRGTARPPGKGLVVFKPNISVKVIDEACVGCNQCVNVCPSGALSMEGKIARLDEPRCVGCMKCVEQCIPYGAIEIVPGTQCQELGMPAGGRDEGAVNDLCADARLDPSQVVCVCTGTTAREVASAILDGLTEPEDITMATGVRAACGWLCLTPVTRLLEANGTPLDRPSKDYRIYPEATKVAIWNIPDGIDEKYPEYRLKESMEAIEAGTLHEPAPWLPDIQPGRRRA